MPEIRKEKNVENCMLKSRETLPSHMGSLIREGKEGRAGRTPGRPEERNSANTGTAEARARTRATAADDGKGKGESKAWAGGWCAMLE